LSYLSGQLDADGILAEVIATAGGSWAIPTGAGCQWLRGTIPHVARYPGRTAFSTFVVTTSAVVRFAPILR